MSKSHEEPPRPTEALARAAWARGDFNAAATLVLEGYGAELYSFVLAQFRRSWDEADDVFSMFREDLWRGLPTFQWRSSVRAWCYCLARNAASRHRRSPHNRVGRHVSIDDAPVVDDMVDRLRTSTQAQFRSEVKSEVQKLREELTQEERDLLSLRIDRRLAWREVAHAMLPASEDRAARPDNEAADEERLRRLEASLRQRFLAVTNRLKRLAKQRGLL